MAAAMVSTGTAAGQRSTRTSRMTRSGFPELLTAQVTSSTTVAFIVGVLGFCSGIGGRGVGDVVAMLTGAGRGQGWGAGSRSGG